MSGWTPEQLADVRIVSPGSPDDGARGIVESADHRKQLAIVRLYDGRGTLRPWEQLAPWAPVGSPGNAEGGAP